MKEIDPTRLVEALLANGWELVGQRTGAYKRLQHPDMDYSYVVPNSTDLHEVDHVDLEAIVAGLKIHAQLGDNCKAVLDEIGGW